MAETPKLSESTRRRSSLSTLKPTCWYASIHVCFDFVVHSTMVLSITVVDFYVPSLDFLGSIELILIMDMVEMLKTIANLWLLYSKFAINSNTEYPHWH